MKLSSLAFLVAISVAPSIAAEPSAAAKLFGALPQAEDVHLSPDGNYLALRSGADGADKFVIMDIAGKDARQLPELGQDSTMVQTVQANWIAWKSQSKLVAGVLSCRETADSEHVFATSGYVIDRDGEKVRPIQLSKGVLGRQIAVQFRDRIISFLPDDPRHVLVEARVQDERYPDVAKVDVETGLSETMIHARPGFTDWMADGAGTVRLAIAFPDGDLRRLVYVRSGADAGWQPIHEDRVGSDPAFVPLAFSRRNPAILFVGVEESGHMAIRQFDTASRSLGDIVAADASVDATPVLRYGELIGYRLGEAPVVYLDDNWRHMAESIRKALPGAEIELVDRSDDGRRGLVLVTDGAQPSTYYLLDKRSDGTHLDPLGAVRTEQAAIHSAPVVEASYPAQDGTLVPAFVTLPPGPRRGPIPFVVLPHDGPSGYDQARFDYLAQFLANKGYGVFQPQFRGSSSAVSATLGSGIHGASVAVDQASEMAGTMSGQPLLGPVGHRVISGKAMNSVFSGTTNDSRRDLVAAMGIQPNAAAQLAKISGPDGVDVMLGPKLDSIVDRNYSGLSNGAGTAYVRAGLGGWGRSIQDDITDGTHWLVAQGYADPARICIAGRGFGGYAALMEAARDSSLYRCAAALAPVTDLDRLVLDAKHFVNANYLTGYLRTNPEPLSQISPVAQADRIDVPVLLVHGRQDCDVPVMQTEEMEAALRRERDKVGSVAIASVRSNEDLRQASQNRTARSGRSVTALYLDGADHSLSQESDRIAYLAALEEFLGTNLAPGR